MKDPSIGSIRTIAAYPRWAEWLEKPCGIGWSGPPEGVSHKENTQIHVVTEPLALGKSGPQHWVNHKENIQINIATGPRYWVNEDHIIQEQAGAELCQAQDSFNQLPTP